MTNPALPSDIRVEICSDDMVALYESECDEIVQALLGHANALITDLSDIWDFAPDQDDITRLSTLLGRTVGEERGVVWELARELRLKRTDHGLQPPRTHG